MCGPQHWTSSVVPGNECVKSDPVLVIITELEVSGWEELWDRYSFIFNISNELTSVMFIFSYVLRMKEFERERRLLQRKKRIEAKASQEAIGAWDTKGKDLYIVAETARLLTGAWTGYSVLVRWFALDLSWDLDL